MRDKLAITNISKAIHKMQKIQNIGQQITNCKYCIATLLCGLCLFVPHNINAVCKYHIDMGGNALRNINDIIFSANVKLYMPYITIGGVKYATFKVSDGLLDSSYRKCTSSDSNVYYLVTGTQRLTACPAGSTLKNIGSSTGSPTPKQVFDAVGTNLGGVPGCSSARIYIAAADSGMRYFNNADHSGNNPVAGDGWSYVSSGYASYTAIPLCKLDWQ